MRLGRSLGRSIQVRTMEHLQLRQLGACAWKTTTGTRDWGSFFVSERGGSPSLCAITVNIPPKETTAHLRENSLKEAGGSGPAKKWAAGGGDDVSEQRVVKTCHVSGGSTGKGKTSCRHVSGGQRSGGDVSSGDISGGEKGGSDGSGDVRSGGEMSGGGGMNNGARVVALTDGFWMEDRPSMTKDGGQLVFSSTREDSGKAHLVSGKKNRYEFCIVGVSSVYQGRRRPFFLVVLSGRPCGKVYKSLLRAFKL